MHLLTLLAQANTESSEFIVGSININPALMRREISDLRKHGLVTSREGKNGGSILAKPAQQIHLSDVFLAVQRNPLLGTARNRPNPNCPVGRQTSQYLVKLHQEAEAIPNWTGRF